MFFGKRNIKLEYEWCKYPINDGLSGLNIDFKKTAYQIRDLWARDDNGSTDETYLAILPAQDVVMLRLKKKVVVPEQKEDIPIEDEIIPGDQ